VPGRRKMVSSRPSWSGLKGASSSRLLAARPLRGRLRKSVSDKLYGLADQVGKPGGKAGMFERLDRFREGFAVSGC
jgi:hypothetical protein